MYFSTFRRPLANGTWDDRDCLGLSEIPGGPILDVEVAARRLWGSRVGGRQVASNVLEVIDRGEEGVALLRRLLEEARGMEGVWWSVEEVRLRAPIPRPRKNVYAIGLNYRAHNDEFTGGAPVSQYPIIFTKGAGSVIGPGDPIESHPQITSAVDYEAELAVVIGKEGRDIPAEEAEQYIFGYTIINDVTARDLQKRTSQWFIGKSLDTFCPMGPYLAHRSIIGWPVELNIGSRVNGEQRQLSNTRLLIFGIATLIESLSKGMTLEPGDIIATGTCEGVGMGYNPPRFLKAGDVVEVEIERLGVLRNPVI